MIKVYHRSVDERDLVAVKRHRGAIARNLMTVSVPVSLVLLGVVYLRWRSVLAASAVALSLFVASLFSNVRFFKSVGRREAQKTDPNAVEVFEVSASEVYEVDHLGSDGPAFCFFPESGKGLLLVGQWLNEAEPFPCDSFLVSRWSDTGKPVRIEPTGRPISAVLSPVVLRASYRLGSVELFDASPSTLQQDLDRAFSTEARR